MGEKKKYKFTVYLKGYNGETTARFEFDNYDDVQNLIGYMIDGSTSIDIKIYKEAVNE